MKNRVSVLGGLALLAALASPADGTAQQFPGTSSILNSPATINLMATLGYAPTDYCGFYHFLSTGHAGQFSDDLLRALLPMCVPWPEDEFPDGSGGGNTGGGNTGGGNTGGGNTGGGNTGGGNTGGGNTGGGNTGGGGDPFGGGGPMATPEPVSLILLGTGLAGIGGFRARRRRSHKED